MSKLPTMHTKHIRALPRVEASPNMGLTAAQARERLTSGYANESPEPPSKTTGRIISDNIFTYFNMIFAVFAICIVSVGSFRDLSFLPIITMNIVIGIIQELRSKSVLSKMTFLTAPKATVIRDGNEVSVPTDQAVLDDVAVFTPGCQIYADAIVLAGECRMNESLVTGEADEVDKKPGDNLFSGSFVVSGTVRARLDKVGRDSFVAGLTIEAKKNSKKTRSEMMHSLSRLVKIISFLIVPMGAVLMFQNLSVQKNPLVDSVVTTVAALLGMIPEGLYLLVSVALTVSVLRLAKRRTLVHEMRCIETLARVDTLCVDKTGTITEPEMNVREVVPLRTDEYPPAAIAQIMADYLNGAPDGNETTLAMARHFNIQPRGRVVKRLPFSSANKYAGAEFDDGSVYLLGAPEKILPPGTPELAEAEARATDGYRVLLLARYAGSVDTPRHDAVKTPVALILLTNKIRDSAPGAFKFFEEQGVTIRVISGDNPATVSRIALDAGIAGAEKYVDASTLKTERHVRRAASEYIVFGRVTPDMKRRLIRAMKAEGHTVAMTGDGVNDVLALKDSDCGIAMASGSEAASHVAQLVLLDSDFGAMPAVVMEGRRVINNLERSSALFLVKNIFSFTVALLAMIFIMRFPMSVSQFSLYNIMFIGIPSFVLALEPNYALVRGRFLLNVFLSALPGGLTSFGALVAIMRIGEWFAVPGEQVSTMATISIAFVGFLMLLKTARPFNPLRVTLLVAMPLGFTLGALILPSIFAMAALDMSSVLFLLAVCAAAVPVMLALSVFAKRLSDKVKAKDGRRRKRKRYDRRRVKV